MILGLKKVCKLVLSVGAALRKFFLCPRLVLGLSWVCPFCCLNNAFVMPWLGPLNISSLSWVKSQHIPYFFPWKAFSKTFKGVQKGYLCSSSSPFIILVGQNCIINLCIWDNDYISSLGLFQFSLRCVALRFTEAPININ